MIHPLERKMRQTETCQSGILASVPTHGRYLWFELKEDHSVENAKSLLNEFLSKIDGKETIVGLGDSALKIMDKNIEGSGITVVEFYKEAGEIQHIFIST